jgi:ribosomal protein L27
METPHDERDEARVGRDKDSCGGASHLVAQQRRYNKKDEDRRVKPKSIDGTILGQEHLISRNRGGPIRPGHNGAS